MVAQTTVIEQDAGDDERPGERPSASLVGARDEPCAKATVEPKQLLAGALHGREDSGPISGRRRLLRSRRCFRLWSGFRLRLDLRCRLFGLFGLGEGLRLDRGQRDASLLAHARLSPDLPA